MRICHFSDIQVRLLKRHKEFINCFENLYNSLKEKKPDCIVVVGDCLHSKSYISAEQINVFIDFLNELVKIAPLYLIAGNHDLVLNNLSRLDPLSPIVKALNNSNINYCKYSGIYKVNDFVDIVVYSCLDENWPTKEQIDKDKINIGLFHGMIQGAVLQNGQPVENCPYELKKFLDEVDYLMLGDIHQQQFLDKEKRAAYPGSLIQQNFGESLEHGYILWEIEAKDKHKVEFIKLPNVCPFYTIETTDSLIIPEDLDLQKDARIRVFSRQLTVFEKKELTDKINSLYRPKELFFVDDANVHRQDIKVLSFNEKLENLDDLKVQEKLLREFLSSQDLPEAQLQKVFEINKLYNNEARKDEDIFRNVQYKLGKMTFHNTFSYGENNEFDFSKHKGIVGVFGKNGCGKSSVVVDIPLYTIFNKISKEGVVKNDLIINEDKEDCASEIEIEIGREKHIISRATRVYVKSGSKLGQPVLQGKTETAYKVVKEDGTEEDCTAEQRQDTDKLIRQRFGTVEDFISTSMAPQWQLLGIVNAKSTERLKLIGRYFDIDIFAKKHKLANEEWKAIKGQLKLFEKRNFDEEFEDVSKKLALEKDFVKKYQEEKSILGKNIQDIDEEILRLKSSLVKIKNFTKEDEKELERLIKRGEEEIKQRSDDLIKTKILIEKKNSFDIDFLQRQLNFHNKIKESKKLISTLENACGCKHQENCSIHEKINNHQKDIEKYLNEIKISQQEIERQMKEWSSINPESEQRILLDIEGSKKSLERYRKEKQEFIDNESFRLSNTSIDDKVREMELKKQFFFKDFKAVEKSHFDHFGIMNRLSVLLDEVKKSKAEYEQIKKNYDVYGFFISAMSKDGIVKKIISDNLNIINSEIKKILSKGVGFEIEIESDEEGDGKAIEIYFKHEKGKKRPVSLLSGMEKTISALVIRAALLNITTLPKCNVFILDEPFGSLDAEYKDAVTQILEYMRTMFDTIILITHDEYFRDIVDYVVEISRNTEGYSIVNS